MNRSSYFRIQYVLILIYLTTVGHAQSLFRTVQAGYWDDPSSWEEFRGSRWLPALISPTASDGPIEIQAGHIITLRGYIFVDELSVSGKLVLEAGSVMADGSASYQVAVLPGGWVESAGQWSGGIGRVYFRNQSGYRHNWQDGEGVIPLAIWDPGSTVEVAGFRSVRSASSAGNWSQDFGNVTWKTSELTYDFSLNGLLRSIRGDFRIIGTNGKVLRFTDNVDAQINIDGDLQVSDSARFSVSRTGICRSVVDVRVGGDFIYNSGHISGSRFCEQGISVFRVAGNFRMYRGLLYFSSGSGGTSTSGADLRVSGNFFLEGGAIDASVAYSNRVGDLYLEGRGIQGFVNTGQVIGSFHYHIAAGSTVTVADGQAIIGSTLEVGDANGGATLIVQSTDLSGAIQKGTSASGNIRVRNQYWKAGSVAVYGGIGKQFISSDHPSIAGVTTIIRNPEGVQVSAAGTTVVCGGNLEVQTGDLLVEAHYLTVRGDLITSSAGTVVVDAAQKSTASSLTVDGAFRPGAKPILFRSSAVSNGGNAVLNLNGDLSGAGYIRFDGPNCQVVVGGSSRVLTRQLPVQDSLALESLTIDATGPLILSIDVPVTVGNYSAASGFSGGLFINNGSLKLFAPMVVTAACSVLNGTLDFSGTELELQRQIRCNPPSGYFGSNRLSTLRVTSAFGGIDNLMSFQPGKDTVGLFVLNRTANYTAVGNLPITPHISFTGRVVISGKLYLRDGEMYHDGGLVMVPGSTLERTPDAAFSAATSASPLGGPYRLVHAKGVSESSVIAGLEVSGRLSIWVGDNPGGVEVRRRALVQDSLILRSGTFRNPIDSLGLADGSWVWVRDAGRCSGAPRGTDYSVLYTGRTMTSGDELRGAVNHLLCRVSDRLEVNQPVSIKGDFKVESGVLALNADSMICRNLLNQSIVHAPLRLRLQGGLENNGTYLSRGGRVYFNGEGFIRGADSVRLHSVTIIGSLAAPTALWLEGDIEQRGRFNAGNGKLIFTGGRYHVISGTTALQLRDLTIDTADTLLVNSAVSVSGWINVGSHSLLNSGDNKLTLESPPGLDGGYLGIIPDDAQVKGNLLMKLHLPAGWGYRYLCSPLDGMIFARINDFIPIKRLYAYDERVTGHKDRGFIPVDWSSHITSGTGYALFPRWSFQGIPLSWTVEGRIENSRSRGTVDLPVSCTPTSGIILGHDGWNLVGNPFPAPIYWSGDSSAWQRKGLYPFVIVPMPDGSSKSYNYLTGVGSLEQGRILPGQAFWVYSGALNPKLAVSEYAKRQPLANRRQDSDISWLSVSVKSGLQSSSEAFWTSLSQSLTDTVPIFDVPSFPDETISVSFPASSGMERIYAHSTGWPQKIPIRVRGLNGDKFQFVVNGSGLPDSLHTILVHEPSGKTWQIMLGVPIDISLFESASNFEDFTIQIARKIADGQADKEDLSWLSVYPNPVTGHTVNFNLLKEWREGMRIRISDITGSVILESELKGKENTVEFPNQFTGMILYSLWVPDETRSGKIIRLETGRLLLAPNKP